MAAAAPPRVTRRPWPTSSGYSPKDRGSSIPPRFELIEMNLAAIDRAIAQAQQALNADPANMYLNTHLAETMRRKLELLRQAAALVPVS